MKNDIFILDRLLISHLFLKKEIGGDRIAELLKDGQEDSVVKRQVHVRVRVHQPTGQGRVRTCQLALEQMSQNIFMMTISKS